MSLCCLDQVDYYSKYSLSYLHAFADTSALKKQIEGILFDYAYSLLVWHF